MVLKKKRKWFAEHKKLLVETYSYEYNPNRPEEFN
jgi:hypothetical protein